MSAARLRLAEARAPKPHEAMTFNHVIVDVNPDGGPPIARGVFSRTRLIPGGSIDEHWPEPWPTVDELPAEMLVRHRHRHGVDEWFDPPILESKLPAATDQEAIDRYWRQYYGRGEYARNPAVV
jgi:hypothetical protein